MPQPTYATTSYGWATRQIIKFGGLALPKIGTTMTYLDLNDAVYFYADDSGFDIGGGAVKNVAGQLTFLAKGVWLSQDFSGRTVKIPVRYDEGGNGTVSKPIGVVRAQLSQSGEQYLTFDNATGLKCKFNGWGKSPVYTYTGTSYVWDTELLFLAKSPFWEDLTATTQNVGAVAGSVGGTGNNFTVAYAGSVFCYPTFTLSVPNTNTVTISSIILANTTSGETLTVPFSPVLTANTIHSIVVNTDAFTVTVDGINYAMSGSFPLLYSGGNPPQNNAFTLTITSSAGTTGLTFSVSYTPRWEQ